MPSLRFVDQRLSKIRSSHCPPIASAHYHKVITATLNIALPISMELEMTSTESAAANDSVSIKSAALL